MARTTTLKNLLLRWKYRLTTTNQTATGLVGLAGEVIDKRTDPGGNIAPPPAQNDRSLGFELEIKFAIAASAQPVVFNGFACTSRSYDTNDPAIAQVVQFLAACGIEAFGQHFCRLLTQQIFGPTSLGCEFAGKMLSSAIGPFA